jgi:hypothetical protein
MARAVCGSQPSATTPARTLTGSSVGPLRPGGGQADDADPDAGALDRDRRRHVRPVDAGAGGGVEEVARQQREAEPAGLDGAGLERGARIVAGGRGRPGTDRAEVELVVADRGRGVTDGAVGRDDGGALVQVGLEGALEHVAGVEEEDGAAVGLAGGADVVDVAGEDGQATSSLRARTASPPIAISTSTAPSPSTIVAHAAPSAPSEQVTRSPTVTARSRGPQSTFTAWPSWASSFSR